MGSSPIRTILVFECAVFCKGEISFVYPQVVNCLIRLAVRTPRCGRGNPGSNPGLDIFLSACNPYWNSWVCTIVMDNLPRARLAQSVERQPFKLVVVGSSPTVGTGSKTHGSNFVRVV